MEAIRLAAGLSEGRTPVELNVVAELGGAAIEGPPGQPLLSSAADVSQLIEACWSMQVGSVILHASNLTPHFFDLSSGEAGSILQKLQNYRIRLAVICPPGAVTFSSRFRELLSEDQRGRAFGVFESRPDALAWVGQ